MNNKRSSRLGCVSLLSLLLMSCAQFGCAALTRTAECERSRDLVGKLRTKVESFEAEVSSELKRNVGPDYDGLILSMDLVCDQQGHMNGDEYKCEVNRHGALARALGDYLAEARNCNKDPACIERVTEAYRTTRANLGSNTCVDNSTSRDKRRTDTGALIPESGTPHGTAFVLGAGGFFTPIGIAFDGVVAVGIDNTNEVGLSFLRGKSNVQNTSSDITGMRLRYSRYFRPESNLKPFIRASIVGIYSDQAPFSVYGQVVDRYGATNIGPAMEGGILFDFARWFGIYAEAIGGVIVGVGGHCTPYQGGQACGDTTTYPLFGGGAGVQFRLVD